MIIDDLNTEFGTAGSVSFVEGKGGFPFINIESESANAVVSLYGGQVLSFQPQSTAEDLLFLSEQAYFQDGKAIKGGIPVCWPWFGADPEGQGRSAHGFARTSLWSVMETPSVRIPVALFTNPTRGLINLGKPPAMLGRLA